MHLERLTVNDFRGFAGADWHLRGAGLEVLSGANNAGKTALLSALDVIAGHTVPGGIKRIGSDGPTKVRARFALSNGDREAVLRATADPDGWRGTSTAFASLTLEFGLYHDESELVLTRVKTTLGPQRPLEIAA